MPVETDIEQTSSYVQNEEQADSSLWSTTTNAISQDEYAKVSEERRQDVEINRWVSLVKSGDIKMIDVPKNILLEVRARM
jgi:squalene cyclase